MESWVISIQKWSCYIMNHILDRYSARLLNYLWQTIRTNTAMWNVPSRGIPQTWTKSTLTLHLIWRLSFFFLTFVSVLEFKWLSPCSMFSDISRFKPFHQSNSLQHVSAAQLPFYFYHGRNNSLVNLCNTHISWRIKIIYWEDTNVRNYLLL